MKRIKIYSFDNMAAFRVDDVNDYHEKQLVYNSSELSICEIFLESSKLVDSLIVSLLAEGAHQI